MLPVSNRTEGVAMLIAIAVGWLLILIYLLMLLTNLISALQDGTSGNLLARVFSFAGLGIDQPWLEAYALANVIVVTVFFSLATRALVCDALAPDPLTMASPVPAPPIETADEQHDPAVSLAEPSPMDRLIGHDSELEQDPQRAMGQVDESAQMSLQNNFVTEPEVAQQLLVALAAFSSADIGRNATLALGAAILRDEATARVALRTLVEEGFLDTIRNGAIPPDGDRDRVRLHPLFVDFSHQRFMQWSD
jgi:hypothetical protein